MRHSSLHKLISGLLVVGLLAQTVPAYAYGENVVKAVRASLDRIKGSKNAFCFAVENGAVTGTNEDMPVRPASVTKVLTTFWAVEALGPNYRFSTRIYVQPSTGLVHVRGTRDPFFDRDRLYTLLADLNLKKVTRINRLTFDSNFWIDYEATEFRYASARNSGGRMSPQRFAYENEMHTTASLAAQKLEEKITGGFNTASWTAQMRGRYARARQMNAAALLPASVNMATAEVKRSEVNPLTGQPGVYVFDIKSAPLRTYLKKMNLNSINPMADEIFHALGGAPVFQRFMQKKYAYGSRVVDVHSGSGVQLNNPRIDTHATCSTMVNMIRRLDLDLEAQGLDLADVLAVPGIEGGTWGDASRSLVVKTGTMKHPTPAKNLAGAESTSGGEVYFGIFIDVRGGNSGSVGNAEAAMMRNFKPVAIVRKPFAFSPIDGLTHMQLVGKLSTRG